ncbi:MAG: DMT family transporter [Gammaproteobacteria bacterium]
MTSTRLPPRALALLVLLTLVWGTNWPLFPVAMREISVWTFRAITLASGGVLLLAFARARGHVLAVPRADWPVLVISSWVYLMVWNLASGYSAITIPSGQTAVVGFTMPLWSALISWAVLGERLSGRLVLAMSAGGAAVLLLMIPGFGAYADAPSGFAAALVGALGWAIGTLLFKRRRIAASATVVTAWQILLAAVPISLGALLLGDHAWFVPSWQSLAAIAYITLIPLCLGNVCWFVLVDLLPANVAGLSSVMIPVVAMISGAVVHDEPLGALQWLAMACSASALWLAMPRAAARRA